MSLLIGCGVRKGKGACLKRDPTKLQKLRSYTLDDKALAASH